PHALAKQRDLRLRRPLVDKVVGGARVGPPGALAGAAGRRGAVAAVVDPEDAKPLRRQFGEQPAVVDQRHPGPGKDEDGAMAGWRRPPPAVKLQAVFGRDLDLGK